jgi:alpha-galactosidase
VPLTADLHGAQYLRLVITDGGDGNSYDRSDWAAARLTCA